MIADFSDAPSDRRRQAQFAAHVPLPCWVRVQGHREGTAPHPGQLRNVGERGALLDLGRRIPPGAMLVFSFETKIGVSDVEAEVIWTTAGPPTSDGPTWIHGLKFLAAQGGVPDPVIESLVRLYVRATFERPELEER